MKSADHERQLKCAALGCHVRGHKQCENASSGPQQHICRLGAVSAQTDDHLIYVFIGHPGMRRLTQDTPSCAATCDLPCVRGVCIADNSAVAARQRHLQMAAISGSLTAVRRGLIKSQLYVISRHGCTYPQEIP